MNRAVLKYLNTQYGDLKPYKTDREPNHIFFMKDDEVIFDYNKKNKDVYISYNIWSFLESFFGLEYKEIQYLTKEWVEEHYKLRVKTTNKPIIAAPAVWRNITN